MIKIEKCMIPIYRGQLMLIVTDSVTDLEKIIPDTGYSSIYAHSWMFPYVKKRVMFQ